MTSVVITGSGAGTWSYPGDCPAGTLINVETWGGGSGGSGTGATNGGGGAGAAYSASSYMVTPNDVASGVAYNLGAGGIGQTGTGLVGGDTDWSTNNLNANRNSIFAGAVVGSPGTMPTNCSTAQGGGLTRTVVGFGIDAGSGFPYFDIKLTGTTATNTSALILVESAAVVTPSVAWISSVYWAFVGGAVTNISSRDLTVDFSNSGTGYISTAGTTQSQVTSTLTRISHTGTTTAATDRTNLYISLNYSLGVAIDITLRIAAPQIELGSSVTFWKSTPGYALAKGGAAPITTSGGVGGATATSIGVTKFAGGSGRAYNVAGSGGGGSAGKDGAGVTATTSAGGAGDNSSGGAADTANVEGGGGGTASTANGGTGGSGGAPGGGGGGSDGASGTRTGGNGANGQIRLTYTSAISAWPAPTVSF